MSEQRQRMQRDIFNRDFLELISSEVVLLMGGLIAGTILAFATNKLLLIPGFFIILPGFLEMRGNISGSVASRLTSGLFLKVVKPTTFASRIVKENIVASFLLAIALAALFGLFLFAYNWFIAGELHFALIFLPLLAGVLANAIEIPLAVAATFYLFTKGHDPNNIIGPFITITGDVVSIFALLVAFLIVL